MLIRLSELRTLIGDVLTEAEKKGGKKGKWVPPWLNKDKAKNEAASADEKKEEKPEVKKVASSDKPAEKKAPPAADVKKEKSASSAKAMPVGHELNKGKGKASGGDAAGKKAKSAAAVSADKPAKKKEAPVAPSKKAKPAVGGKPFVSPDKDVVPKNRGKMPTRVEFGVDDEFSSRDLGSGEDLSADVNDMGLEAPQSLEDVPTNVVGLRVWLRDFVAPRVPESQMGAFHRLVSAFVSQAEERQLAAKEPEMTKRLGVGGQVSKKQARPTKLGQPAAVSSGKPSVANLAEKKK